MVNAENMKTWVAALRSGQYQQGTKRLRVGDKFCCLGVACEVYLKANPDGLTTRVKSDEVVEGDVWHYDDEPSFLPEKVMNWLGVDIFSPGVTREGVDASLTYVNDTGTNFNDIADMIEDRYLKVAA